MVKEFRCVGYIGREVWNQALLWWDDDHWFAEFYINKEDDVKPRTASLPTAWEVEPAFP